MKYYTIETDKKNPLPDIRDIYSEINVNYFTLEKEHKLKDYYAFKMQTMEETLVPDIITSPFFMVKEEIFKAIMIYMSEIKVKYISFVDDNRGLYMTYIAPVLEIIRHDDLDAQNILDKVLFYVSYSYHRRVVVRLDLMESILRRHVIGINVQEFFVSGGK